MQDTILKDAKECRTKAQWEGWVDNHGKTLSSTNNSKLLEEIFKLLKKDSHSLQYGASLWASLLEGCLSSWNLELGLKVVDFSRKIKSPSIVLPSAKLYLESGFPVKARHIISNGLRMSHLETKEKLQLETLSCSSYIEEGNRTQAAKILRRIEKNVYDKSLLPKDRADFLTYVARTLFLFGQYKRASKIFDELSSVYQELEMWENTAKSLFNAAASLENAGEGSNEITFNLVERCRRLAEEHNLKGTLAHCEAFYGHNDYWRGNFAGAREHYRQSLQYIPASDKSYRRLHLLSMLAFTYLRTGRFHLAKKFGQQTLDLAALEETDRFALRYDNLEAELLCEQGLFDESQALLKSSTSVLLQKGVNTLEDLAIVARYIFQSCMLGERNVTTEFSINDQLKKNQAAQLEYLHALGHFELFNKNYERAEALFEECIAKSAAIEDQYFRALGYLGLIENSFARGDSSHSIESNLRKFEIYAGRMVETPLKARVKIILAALEYRNGKFDRCAEILVNASKLTRLSYLDKFCINTWLSTIEGKSTRFPTPEHESLIARMTKIYFNPRLSVAKPNTFTVNGLYTINLEKHPSIAEVLTFLFHSSEHSTSAEELQKKVWAQSVKQLGWQQKIRNTINRLRGFFPYTMAPVIIHDKQLRLFHKAIEFEITENQPKDNRSKLLRLLKQEPHSSSQIAEQLKISPATAKRLLRQLSDENSISQVKIGRRVFYQNLNH